MLWPAAPSPPAFGWPLSEASPSTSTRSEDKILPSPIWSLSYASSWVIDCRLCRWTQPLHPHSPLKPKHHGTVGWAFPCIHFHWLQMFIINQTVWTVNHMLKGLYDSTPSPFLANVLLLRRPVNLLLIKHLSIHHAVCFFNIQVYKLLTSQSLTMHYLNLNSTGYHTPTGSRCRTQRTAKARFKEFPQL